MLELKSVLNVTVSAVYMLTLLFAYGFMIFSVPALLMLIKKLRKAWVFALSSALCAVLLIASMYKMTASPHIIIPDEYALYITEEKISDVTDSLAICNPWKLCVPLYIEIVSASETHISAEAHYTGFGGELGVTQRYENGIKTSGELYPPN